MLFGAAGAARTDDSPDRPDPEAKLLEIGKVAPDFTLPLIGGGEVTLGQVLKFQKAVIVGFFSTEAERGGEALPKLQKLHAQLEEKGLATIAVNPVEEKREIEDFVKAEKLTFQVAIDGQETNRAVTHVYHARSLPTFYVLDPAGKVLYRSVGLKEEPLRDALAKAGLK
jgi:peroxiredoxin